MRPTNPQDPPFCSRVLSCLHRKRYMTFFSLQQRNQVKLHLLDRKESLKKILRPKKRVFSSKWLEQFAWLDEVQNMVGCI